MRQRLSARFGHVVCRPSWSQRFLISNDLSDATNSQGNRMSPACLVQSLQGSFGRGSHDHDMELREPAHVLPDAGRQPSHHDLQRQQPPREKEMNHAGDRVCLRRTE